MGKKTEVKMASQVALSKISWATEARAVALGGVIVGALLWVPLAIILSARALWRRSKEWTWSTRALVVLAVACVLRLPARRWPALRQMKFWEPVVAYFDPKVWINGPLPDRPLLFAFVPHGVFPLGQAVGLVSWLNETFRSMRPAVADSMIKAPLVGQFLTALGCVSASVGGMESAIAAGDSVCLVPGGIAEMFEPAAGVQSLCLARRKGFVKLALRHGIPLVPVYVFGNTDALRLASWAKADWLQQMSRKLGVALLWFWGRWYLPIPFRVPLRYAVGDAIEVPMVAHPSPQEVDRWHGIFVAAVRALYDGHKNTYYGANPPLLKII